MLVVEYCKAVTENGMMKLMVILDTFYFLGIEEPSFCCVSVSASIVTFGSEKKGALFEGHISHFLLRMLHCSCWILQDLHFFN